MGRQRDPPEVVLPAAAGVRSRTNIDAGTRCRRMPGPSTYSSIAIGPYAWK